MFNRQSPSLRCLRPVLQGTLLATAACVAAGASPLRVEPPVIELGDVQQGEAVQAQAVLMNVGDTEIVIREIGRTCPDCLSFSLHDDVLVPGDATILEMVYDTVSATISTDVNERTGIAG